MNYVSGRLLGMVPTLALISIIVFIVIQLPPGDIVTSTLDRLQASGVEVSAEQVQNLRAQYNLDKPMYMQYVHVYITYAHKCAYDAYTVCAWMCVCVSSMPMYRLYIPLYIYI